MAEEQEREAKRDSNTLKEISKKLGDMSENTIGATMKLGGSLNDAFRATFSDSPLLASIADIGESLGKDVLGLFKGSDSSPELDEMQEANKISGEQRKELKEELKSVTQQIEDVYNKQLDDNRSDNEKIIDQLQDIKDVWDAGDDAETRREESRRADELLSLQEQQNKLLEQLAERSEGDEELGFFDRIKDQLVLTVTGLVAFLKSPLGKIAAFFKPLSGIFKKFIKVLGPIGLIVATLIGAFTGFNKATSIFGENATFLEKVISSLAGILSGLTFGLIDIEPLALGMKRAATFMYETFQPFIESAGKFFGDLWTTLGSGFNLLKAFFTGTPSEIDAAMDDFLSVFSNMGESFSTAIGDLMAGVTGITNKIGTWIGETVAKMFSGMTDYIKNFIILLPFGEKILKGLGVNTEDLKLQRKESGEDVYDKLKGSDALNDRFGRSDTMSSEDIGKLSISDNAALRKYLLSSGNADKKSQIITDLQEQLEKSKREESKRGKEGNVNSIVDASNTNNVTNINYLKPSARNPDTSMKTAILST